MGSGIEPFSARQIVDWLTARDCKLVRQSGSHLFFRTPDGVTVGCPDPGSDHVVTTLVARKIAMAFGMSMAMLRADFGYQPTKTGRAKPQPRTAPARERKPTVPSADWLTNRLCTVAQVARLSPYCRDASHAARGDLAELLAQIEAWVKKNGQVSA